MLSESGIQRNYSGTQVPSGSRNKAELKTFFKQDQGIDAEAAETALKYFLKNPVVQDGGSSASNLTLDTAKHLYESLPETLSDGRPKLTAMVVLIRQIIAGTSNIDFNDWQASFPHNEFVDYLVGIITHGIDHNCLGADEAFAECLTGIRTLKDGSSVFEYYLEKMPKDLHAKCLALTLQAGITETNVEETSKFNKNNPTTLTAEIAEQISVKIARQYTAGLNYLHAYNERRNDQDLAAAIKCFRCCFDQGKEFINAEVERKSAGHDINGMQTSVSYAVYAISYSAYALFHVHTLVQNKKFYGDEATEFTKWFSNIPEISFKNRLEDHLAGKIVLSLDGMRLVISMLRPLFNDPNSLFSALDKYAERPGEIVQTCEEHQQREKLFKQAERMDNDTDDLNLKVTYLFQAAKYDYFDVDEPLQLIFSLMSSGNAQHVLELTPAMAKHAAAYFDKYPDKAKGDEFKFLFDHVKAAIKHNTFGLSEYYVDLAFCANFKHAKYIVAYMKKAADELNHPKAAIWYAHHLLTKNKPALKNEAIKYYRLSADGGHFPAQQWLAISGFHNYAYMVGVQHLEGNHAQGIIKDEDAAINWLSMATNEPRALWLLGVLEERRRNLDGAEAYFQRAFEFGHLPTALEKTISGHLALANGGDTGARTIVARTAAALSDIYKEDHPAYFPKPDLKRSKKYADLANRFAIEPKTITIDNAEK